MIKKWVHVSDNQKAGISEIRCGSTKYAVFDRTSGEPLQYVTAPDAIGIRICDEWDARLAQWARRTEVRSPYSVDLSGLIMSLG